MGTKHLVAAAIVAVGTASALAAPASADPTTNATPEQIDQVFTKAVRDKGFRITPKQAIEVAGSTCDVLRRGGSIQDALKHIKNSTDFTSVDDMAAFGSLAVSAYCPSAMPKS